MHDVLQKTLDGLSPEIPAGNPATPQHASIEDISPIYHGAHQPRVQEEEEEDGMFSSDDDNGEMEAEDDESDRAIEDNDGNRKPAIVSVAMVKTDVFQLY